MGLTTNWQMRQYHVECRAIVSNERKTFNAYNVRANT